MHLYHSTSQIYLAILMLQICVFASRDDQVKQPSDHKCTKIMRKEHLTHLQERGPCEVSYKARCGWFSLDLCTFYKREICEKNSNVTQYKYSKVEVCCDGFIEAPNGTCISKKSADPQWIIDKETNNTDVYVNIGDIPKTTPTHPRKNQQVVHTDKAESTISAGAIAGAGCAALFLITVSVFTIMGIYKRRKSRPKKASKTEKDDAGMTMLTTSTTST